MIAKLTRLKSAFAAAAIASAVLVAGRSPAADLARAVPPEAHFFVTAKHNPERDFQRKYLADVWQTFCDERIAERLVAVVTGNMDAEKLDRAKSIWQEVQDAAAPIDLQALGNAKEFAMFQELAGPTNVSTFLLQLDGQQATQVDEGLVNLMRLVEQKSEGKAAVKTADVGGVTMTSFQVPPEMPMNMCVGHRGDVLIVSMSEKQFGAAAARLGDSSLASKMDDPRVAEALAALPAAEDGFIFMDGKLMFDRLENGIPAFVAEKAPQDEKAQRFMKVFKEIVDEFAILDFEATSQSTDGLKCRTTTYGKVTEDFADHALGKALAGGEEFADWHKWVPAGATSYSLNRGVNLHEIYVGALNLLNKECPDANKVLAKFEEVQTKVDVHLDADILQSFPGEIVSVAFPSESADGAKASHSVTALRCTNPEKIRELTHRGFEAAKQIPFLQAQQLDMVACSDLEGFEEVKCALLAMSGARPVVGFADGWMICASSPAAAKQFLAVRKGEAPSIEKSASLAKFDLKYDGPVVAVSYSDVGAGVRKAADFIDKASMMAPMMMGALAAKAKPEDLKPIQELVGLLPSVAKVVRKFDFVEDRLSITHVGPKPHTYVREIVQLVRDPETAKTN